MLIYDLLSNMLDLASLCLTILYISALIHFSFVNIGEYTLYSFVPMSSMWVIHCWEKQLFSISFG